jgi:hypothetical protein
LKSRTAAPDTTARQPEQAAQRRPSISAFTHERNQGYGAALRSGFGAAVLYDEFRVVKLASARARERFHTLIDIQNTRTELNYVRGQWAAMIASAPAHKRSNVVQALNRLDQRLLGLEAKLVDLKSGLRAI